MRNSSLGSLIFAYGAAALASCVFSYFLFTKDFIKGNSKLFEDGDFSQHLSGWQFYRDDEWRFPILHTKRLNAPEGISIVFTDSIPLLALLFKIFSLIIPDNFQYFGFWYIFIVFFQAIGSVFLIRSLGCYQWYAALAAIAFSFMVPAWPWRLGHSSLMAHGFILFALGFYLRGINNLWGRRYSAWLLGLTALVGLLIHPYWFAICSGIFLAFLIDDLRTGGSWKVEIYRLIFFLGALVFILFVFGYTGSTLRAEGFGLYSMNLVAPFCGGRLTPCYVDATGGQYEGFNYLGAGGLLLVFIGIIMIIRHHKMAILLSLWRNHLGLVLCATAYAIYSLSNKIYFANNLIIEYPLPEVLDKLTGIFRASGRFFWVNTYLLLFVFLTITLKKIKGRYLLIVLALALIIQFYDIEPHWQRFASRVRDLPQHNIDAWKGLLSNVEQINLYPAFGCGEGEIDQYFFFQRLAAHYHLKLDSGYIARTNVDCHKKGAKFWHTFEKNQFYILAAPFFSRNPMAIPDGFKIAIKQGECAQWRYALLCKPGMSSEDWSKVPLKIQSTARYENDKLQWLADNLHTNIGIVVDGELRPADSKAHDFLSFGPYVSLPAGRYRVFLEYRSNLPTDQPAGAWDAVAAPIDGGRRYIYGEGTLLGTFGNLQSVVIEFEIYDQDGPLEIRTIYPGYGDLRIVRLIIEKL